jgi:hypothetical protein
LEKKIYARLCEGPSLSDITGSLGFGSVTVLCLFRSADKPSECLSIETIESLAWLPGREIIRIVCWLSLDKLLTRVEIDYDFRNRKGTAYEADTPPITRNLP